MSFEGITPSLKKKEDEGSNVAVNMELADLKRESLKSEEALLKGLSSKRVKEDIRRYKSLRNKINGLGDGEEKEACTKELFERMRESMNLMIENKPKIWGKVEEEFMDVLGADGIIAEIPEVVSIERKSYLADVLNKFERTAAEARKYLKASSDKREFKRVFNERIDNAIREANYSKWILERGTLKRLKRKVQMMR